MPSSLAVSPLLIPAARKYAASDAMRMSHAHARQKPPPIAAPLIAPITGWCILRIAVITSSRSSSAPRDRGDGQTVDVRHDAGVLEVGARAEPVTRAGEHDDAHVVVVAERLERLAQRDHHVERHRVHPLGTVQRHERDVRAGLVDLDE